MQEIKQIKVEDIESKHKSEHEGYEYYKKEVVTGENSKQCKVSIYEIPPGKSAYPYHYHVKNEEIFYIIKGTGELITPSGIRQVSPGDFLFFPANEKGAHKLTNNSDDMLVYIDFDTENDIDIAFYPESNKVGVFGLGINQIYKTEDRVDYYKDE